MNYQNRIVVILLALLCTANAIAEDKLITTLTPPPQSEKAAEPKPKAVEDEVVTFTRDEIEASGAKTIGDLLVAQGFKDESRYLCSEASARRVMEVSTDDKMIDAMVSQMQNGLAPMVRKDIEEVLSSDFSEDEIKLLVERLTQWQIQELSARFKSKQWRDATVEIIRRIYTEEETTAVIAMYESEGWRVVRDKMPLMLGESIQISQRLLSDVITEHQAKLKQLAAEIIAERAKQKH